jgi:hypothetical protein
MKIKFVTLLVLLVASLSFIATLAQATESDEELAKQTQNPIASLISLPLQSNWDFNIGPTENKTNYLMNVQPVIPVSISENYNLIIRTILPIKANQYPVEESGIGDVLQSFFISPKVPLDGWIVGGGPVMLYPSAADKTLGGGKWGAGPTAVFLKQQSGFTFGLLANHVWSFAGCSDRSNISSTFLQPFFSYTTKSYTTFGVNTESTYDWINNQWTVPVNFTVTQLLRIAGQPLTLQIGPRYYADKPTNGPDWGVRFAVTFLFPK